MSYLFHFADPVASYEPGSPGAMSQRLHGSWGDRLSVDAWRLGLRAYERLRANAGGKLTVKALHGFIEDEEKCFDGFFEQLNADALAGRVNVVGSDGETPVELPIEWRDGGWCWKVVTFIRFVDGLPQTDEPMTELFVNHMLVAVLVFLDNAVLSSLSDDSAGVASNLLDAAWLAERVAALNAALNEVAGFAQMRGVALEAIARAQGFVRIGLIDDAVEAFLATEADKKHFLQLASRVSRLFKAILPDAAANELAPLSVLVSYLAAKIQALGDPPDISAVMSDVEALLNDSIATEGYRIGPASNPEALVNLSEIDFAALQAKFAQGHKRTEAEKLKRLIAGKLALLVALNASRMDLAEKFQALIDEYNAGSQNIEAFFEELKKFAQDLTVEEQRGIAEGLTEEELALFDILTKPEPVLTKAEEAEVKKVCRELLATLKREKLVLDWREKQQAKAGVMQTIRSEIRRLPATYTKDVRMEKLARAYAHVYDHFGAAFPS